MLFSNAIPQIIPVSAMPVCAPVSLRHLPLQCSRADENSKLKEGRVTLSNQPLCRLQIKTPATKRPWCKALAACYIRITSCMDDGINTQGRRARGWPDSS